MAADESVARACGIRRFPDCQSIVLSTTPGPNLTYVFASGLAHGRRAGLVSEAGVVSGLVAHTLLVALGLAALVAESDTAFDIICYAGAAYLLWMGIRLIRASRP